MKNVIIDNLIATGPYGYIYPIRYTTALPASGIYFRHVKNLSMHNVNVITLEDDARDEFVFDDVEGLRII